MHLQSIIIWALFDCQRGGVKLPQFAAHERCDTLDGNLY
jgi:hypothetical protein